MGNINGNTEFDMGELVVITNDKITQIERKIVLHKLINNLKHTKSAVYSIDDIGSYLNKIWDSESKFRCDGFGKDRVYLNGGKTNILKIEEEVNIGIQELIGYIKEEGINYEDYLSIEEDNYTEVSVRYGVINVENYSEESIFKINKRVVVDVNKKELDRVIVLKEEDRIKIRSFENVRLDDVINECGKEVKVYYVYGEELIRI